MRSPQRRETSSTGMILSSKECLPSKPISMTSSITLRRLPQECRSRSRPAAWTTCCEPAMVGKDVLAQHGRRDQRAGGEAQVVAQEHHAHVVDADGVGRGREREIADPLADRLDQVGLVRESVGEGLEAHQPGGVLEDPAEVDADLHALRNDSVQVLDRAVGDPLGLGPRIGLEVGPAADGAGALVVPDARAVGQVLDAGRIRGRQVVGARKGEAGPRIHVVVAVLVAEAQDQVEGGPTARRSGDAGRLALAPRPGSPTAS